VSFKKIMSSNNMPPKKGEIPEDRLSRKQQ